MKIKIIFYVKSIIKEHRNYNNKSKSINNNIKWDLTKGKNFGIYYNDIPKLNSIFIKHNYFQHYENQWHDSEWRMIDIQKNKISNEMLIEFMKIYKN